MALSLDELEVVSAALAGSNARELNAAADDMSDRGRAPISDLAIADVRRLVRYMIDVKKGAVGDREQERRDARLFDRHNR